MFREMRRFKQALDEKKCLEILEQEKRLNLALIGDDGYPYIIPVNYVFLDGKICIHSAKAGHKIDAIARNPKVSCLVYRQKEQAEDGWSWFLESVAVFGKAELVEDEARKEAALHALGMKYFPSEEMVVSDMARNGARAAVIEITPEHISGKRVHER